MSSNFTHTNFRNKNFNKKVYVIAKSFVIFQNTLAFIPPINGVFYKLHSVIDILNR